MGELALNIVLLCIGVTQRKIPSESEKTNNNNGHAFYMTFVFLFSVLKYAFYSSLQWRQNMFERLCLLRLKFVQTYTYANSFFYSKSIFVLQKLKIQSEWIFSENYYVYLIENVNLCLFCFSSLFYLIRICGFVCVELIALFHKHMYVFFLIFDSLFLIHCICLNLKSDFNF